MTGLRRCPGLSQFDKFILVRPPELLRCRHGFEAPCQQSSLPWDKMGLCSTMLLACAVCCALGQEMKDVESFITWKDREDQWLAKH